MKFLASHESSTRGTFDFPIELYYVDKMHPRYEMPFHWHMEFELMLFSLFTNCCTADTILRILCREPQRTGDRRTVLERLAHHGDIGVRIGRSSGSHRQELLADILHRKSDVLELFSSFIDLGKSRILDAICVTTSFWA